MFGKHTDGSLNERQQRIYDFLKSTRTGVLSTVDADGEPHGVVIYHSIDEHFGISFITKKETRKYDNLKHKNHASLVVYEPVSQTIVQVTGVCTEITDVYKINSIASKIFMVSLKTSEGGIPPIAKLNAGEYTAFYITPKQITMASYLRPDSGDYDKIFESVESFDLKKEI